MKKKERNTKMIKKIMGKHNTTDPTICHISNNQKNFK